MTYDELEHCNTDVLLGGPLCGQGVDLKGFSLFIPHGYQNDLEDEEPTGYYPTDECDSYLRRVWIWHQKE